MRLAAPIIRGEPEEIAPRFCCARTLMLWDLEAARVTAIHHTPLPVGALPERLEWVASLHIDHLVCGGFNRHFIPFAEGLGLKIHVGRFGPAAPHLRALIMHEIEGER